MDWFLYDNGLRHERVKGPLAGLKQFLTIESPLKIMKNVLFFKKSSFRSRDIYIFALTFWLRK